MNELMMCDRYCHLSHVVDHGSVEVEMIGQAVVVGDSSASRAELHRDQLRCLLRLEKAYVVEYLPCRAGLNTAEDHMPLDEWRRRISQWSYRVIDHFRMDRAIVAVALNLLDRFLVAYVPPHNGRESPGAALTCLCPSCKRNSDSQTYQLAAMSCLSLAIKLHVDNGSDEDCSRRKNFQLDTFAELSRGMFDVADICALEETVLRALKWKVNYPDPMTLVYYLLTMMPETEEITRMSKHRYDLVIHVVRELSRYLTELAVSVGSCVHYKPSQIAFASILVAMDLVTHQALPQSVRDGFSTRVYHLGFCDKPGLVERIRQGLKKSLWPDMILEEGDIADPGHPITMARACGILNLDQIHPMSTYSPPPLSPPGTPPGHLPGQSVVQCSGQPWEASGSPVGVDR